jgi:transcriptional regulator with XRE-family HTH domain
MKNNLIDYSDRLVWAMAQADFDTTKLSKALGLSYQAVKKVEQGKSKSLSAYNNQIAADVLGVNARWLATGIGIRIKESCLLDAAPELLECLMDYEAKTEAEIQAVIAKAMGAE